MSVQIELAAWQRRHVTSETLRRARGYVHSSMWRMRIRRRASHPHIAEQRLDLIVR